MMGESATEFDHVNDSGKREEFETGARRDTQEGKPRFGLIPPYPLFRLAMHYTNGAKKYGENNWTKGILGSRTWESLERHVQAYKEGDKSEDHLAAIAWNAFALIWTEKYKPNLYDLAAYLCWPAEGQEEPTNTDLQPASLSWQSCQECEPKRACPSHEDEARTYWAAVHKRFTEDRPEG